MRISDWSSDVCSSDLTTRLPAFTRVDAALFFKANERLEFQVNVEKLLDESYFSDAHNNNNITPGAPINARFRSAEHTSALQSLLRISYAVSCSKKKNISHIILTTTTIYPKHTY